MSDQDQIQPHLRVEAGSPTSQELAVVIALLQAAQSAAAASAKQALKPKSSWHRNASVLRTPVIPGHNQWQSSFRRGLN